MAKYYPLSQAAAMYRYGSLININLSGSQLHRQVLLSAYCFEVEEDKNWTGVLTTAFFHHSEQERKVA